MTKIKSPDALADDLVDMVVRGLSRLTQSTAPALELPPIYGGHVVDDNTRTDLLYVLTLLVEHGLDSVAGVNLRQRSEALLSYLHPSRIEGFWAYRVGEAVQRLGGLDALPHRLRSHALRAASSPRLIADVLSETSTRRPNYLAVAARCLYVSRGLAPERPSGSLDALLPKLRTYLSASGTGWVNDGQDGRSQYDIYTPEVYLLLEPVSSDIGSIWEEGFRRVINDLDDLALPGGAVVWGRSTGILGQAMSLQLAGVIGRRHLTPFVSRWLARVPAALSDLERSFEGGVANAHVNRGFDSYRGPSRRLQLTFDIYGKVLLAARALRQFSVVPAAVDAEPYPAINRLVRFSEDSTAAAWVYRSKQLSFVLPLMAGESASYLSSPRSPGLFEQPVAPLAVMLPVVTKDGETLAPIGDPVSIKHEKGRLTVRQDGWFPVAAKCADSPTVAGTRVAVYEAHGKTLSVREQLNFFDEYPSVTVSVPSRRAAPLSVTVDGVPVRQSLNTNGIAEWCTPWGEIDEVREEHRTGASFMTWTWSMTAPLRVGTTEVDHPYSNALYGGLRDRVVFVPVGAPGPGLAESLADMDVLHLAWPERWSGSAYENTRSTVDAVRSAGVPVVWTQHNLLPHRRKDAEAGDAYQLWARAAAFVIHHTAFGRQTAMSSYEYDSSTRHVVIPHGHWGAEYDRLGQLTRAHVEHEEGWPPVAIRLAVIGQPRAEKDLQSVIDAVAQSARSDIQLIIRVGPDVRLPRDGRVIPLYGHASRNRYHRRMLAYDGVVLPFAPDGLLATGTAFDCIGAGVAPIASNWQFLREVFGEAAIYYGSTTSELADCIEGLTPERLTSAGAAAAALRGCYEWSDSAAMTYRVFQQAASVRADGGKRDGRVPFPSEVFDRDTESATG